jgi:hypothetical protein
MPAIFRLPQSVDLSTDIRVTIEDTLRTIVAELAAARPGSALAANGGCNDHSKYGLKPSYFQCMLIADCRHTARACRDRLGA